MRTSKGFHGGVHFFVHNKLASEAIDRSLLPSHTIYLHIVLYVVVT
jgi:hypothetical protein